VFFDCVLLTLAMKGIFFGRRAIFQTYLVDASGLADGICEFEMEEELLLSTMQGGILRETKQLRDAQLSPERPAPAWWTPVTPTRLYPTVAESQASTGIHLVALSRNRSRLGGSCRLSQGAL